MTLALKGEVSPDFSVLKLIQDYHAQSNGHKSQDFILSRLAKVYWDCRVILTSLQIVNILVFSVVEITVYLPIHRHLGKLLALGQD